MLPAKMLLQIQLVSKLLRANVTDKNFAFVVMIVQHMIPHLLVRVKYFGTDGTDTLFLLVNYSNVSAYIFHHFSTVGTGSSFWLALL